MIITITQPAQQGEHHLLLAHTDLVTQLGDTLVHLEPVTPLEPVLQRPASRLAHSDGLHQ